jgi:hypothetical protein
MRPSGIGCAKDWTLPPSPGWLPKKGMTTVPSGLQVKRAKLPASPRWLPWCCQEVKRMRPSLITVGKDSELRLKVICVRLPPSGSQTKSCLAMSLSYSSRMLFLPQQRRIRPLGR